MPNPSDFDWTSRFPPKPPGNPWARALHGGTIATLVLLALIVAGALSSYYTVQPEGKAVVRRFGRVIGVRDPGLHFKLPFGIDRATFVPTERVLKEEFGFRTLKAGQRTQYERKTPQQQQESLMLTGDLNVVDVEWVVQYKIDDPEKYLFRVRNQRESIRDVAEAVMRRIVGNRVGSDVLTVGRVEIANEARREMQQILDSYDLGVHISTVELQDVTPPDPVKPAFNEVNEARQEKERLINEAEKHRNQVIPKAEGEAKQIIAEARGRAAERVNRARGEASRYKAVLAEYLQAPDVTRRRLYLETIDRILGKVDHIYVADDSGGSPFPLLHLNPPPAAGGSRGEVSP